MALLRYNHTAQKMVSNGVNIAGLRLILLSSQAIFDPVHTTQAQVTNNEAWVVEGNGWPVGGVLLPSFAITIINTDDAMADFADISKIATGGPIGPAYSGLISDGTIPLFFQDFLSAQIAPVGTPFNIYVNVNGLYRVGDLT